MGALSDDAQTLKFVHTYGVGLHSDDPDPDVHDPRWQKRQVDDFVEFAVEAEELGFDGVAVTEHHAPLMTCPVAAPAAGGRGGADPPDPAGGRR
jgi:alkanesulfonate monooxygenase SsuD/methylene tetrahydromethanopterin reductase-like flavin-dependent oxidoreductase (luciferase family)